MSVYIYMSELFLYNWGYVLIYVKILKNAQNAAQEIFKIKASDSHFFYISLTIPLSFVESNAVKLQIATADLCFESNAQY